MIMLFKSKQILLIIVQIVLAYSQYGYNTGVGASLIGTYTVNRECSRWFCPRDYVNSYSFVCPKSGYSMARIQ